MLSASPLIEDSPFSDDRPFSEDRPFSDDSPLIEDRPFSDESDPKRWLELVEPDEFPLSMFYLQLRGKLEPRLAAFG